VVPPPGALPDETLLAPPPVSAPRGADDVTVITAAPPVRRRTNTPWLALAASLVLLIAAAAYAAWLNGRNDTLAERLAAADGENQRLRAMVAQQEFAMRALEAPGLRVIDLAAGGGGQPAGRMLWNPVTDQWLFFAHNLPQLPQEREYQLWLITPGRRLSAGTFVPTVTGSARIQATFALPPDSLRAVAVTEEPAGGVPEPTGPIVIAGQHAAE
ncbi:MAG TPA: anti-sigma factor, partial [Longimicrobiaceae bacterium]|nr:anti-sigma factor [Longimicrobiaceae bacterium]